MKGILIYIILSIIPMFATDKEAYKVFSKSGEEAEYSKILEAAMDADIVLFGEMHNNPIIHWLQLELIKDIHANDTNQTLVLGAEMFESDDQLVLNEFLKGTIRGKDLEKEAKVWNNFATDYKPLLEFAQTNGFKFIATNIPRRYASLVARSGFDALDSLDENAKNLICPLPVQTNLELESYKAMDQMGGMGHGMSFLKHAQAAKDATMAHFINKNLDGIFIHFNGSYHSDSFEGIYWHLKNMNKDLKIVTISSREQNSLTDLSDDNKEIADFIIVTPSTMTKTY